MNENPIDKLIRELKEENERLKKSLGGGPVDLGSDAAGMSEDEQSVSNLGDSANSISKKYIYK